MDVYADQACTQRATGRVTELYVKIGETIALGSQYEPWGSPDDVGELAEIFAPTELNPEDPYWIRLYRDFESDQLTRPIPAGTVLEVSTGTPVDVTGFQTEFFLNG